MRLGQLEANSTQSNSKMNWTCATLFWGWLGLGQMPLLSLVVRLMVVVDIDSLLLCFLDYTTCDVHYLLVASGDK